MFSILADYRINCRHQNTSIESLKDAKSPIRFIRKHADTFHIDTAKIVASGSSVGGHLEAATALAVMDMRELVMPTKAFRHYTILKKEHPLQFYSWEQMII
ncbi:MAG: alpha/beta hydrolase fold domain-containing protein [Balneolaceae bacterium]|nr:alpha/beta hydrolase fold domain-containing protein [Balneolaceae bacterium]